MIEGWWRRAAPIVVITLVIGALAGCSAASGPAPTLLPTPAPTGSSSAAPLSTITFDEGAQLNPRQSAAWVDPLSGTAGYTVKTSNGGSGSWSYVSDDTHCVIGYWQGALSAATSGVGDSALSDQLLAAQFGTTAAAIATYVVDAAGPFRTPSALVQTRAVPGADSASGTTYLFAARALGALGTGFVATLTCPGAINIANEWTRLSSTVDAFGLVFAAR